MATFLEWLTASQTQLQSLGWGGVLAYAGIIVVVQFCLAPLSPVAIAGGFIFGLGRGYIAITIGTAFGAALNFLLARHLARGFVARRLEQSDKFQLIDSAIGREGWKIIALLRFCPIPFGFGNYAYGLTAIPFWPYFIATVIAIVPGNVFFVWLGATAHAGVEAILGSGRPRHPLEYVLMFVGLIAAFSAMTYIGKVARTALAKQSPAAG